MSERNGTSGFPPQTVARNIGDFAHDVLILGELQMELFKVDTNDCLARLVKPVGLLAAAAICSLGCVPIALMTVAFGLAAAGLSTWLAFLLATACGLLFAAILGVIGWRLLRQSPVDFTRSKNEFASNFQWVKQVVTTHQSGRPTSANPPHAR